MSPDEPRPAANDEPMIALEEWFAGALGRELAALEEDSVGRMLHDTFGYYLVQLGMSGTFDAAVRASRIRHRILLPVGVHVGSGDAQALARPHQLPVAADSVDVVLLPHTLDFTPDAPQVLREAERVLIAEGRVVVVGFNALSLWGLGRLVRGPRSRVPWCGSFLTPFRIADWLRLLGFDIEMQEMMMFRPPWRRTLLQRLSFVESLGRRYWPFLGGVYVIRAVKRVSTLTPLRPAWKRRRPVIPGAVEPTARRTGRL